MANKWPKECPVFEIVNDDGEHVPKGGIVEGVNPFVGGWTLDHRFLPAWGIGMRVPDEAVLRHPVTDPSRRSPTEGWYGIVCRPGDVKPLTPAARAMLAIAKAAAK